MSTYFVNRIEFVPRIVSADRVCNFIPSKTFVFCDAFQSVCSCSGIIQLLHVTIAVLLGSLRVKWINQLKTCYIKAVS